MVHMAFFPILVKVDFGTENSFSSSSLYFVEMFSMNLHEKRKRGFLKRRLKPCMCMYMYFHGIFQFTFITKMIGSVMFAGSKLWLYNARRFYRCTLWITGRNFWYPSSKNIFHLKHIVFACTCTGFIFYRLIKVKT